MSSELRVDRIIPTTGVGTNQMGGVIQYVQATHTVMTEKFNTSSTSYVDTGYSLTITPRSTSSKILIYANLACYSPGRYGLISVYNSTADRYVNFEGGVTNDEMYQSAMGNASQWTMLALEAVDLPNSTSAQTYKIYAKTSLSSATFTLAWTTTAPNTMNMNFMSATEYSA